MVEPASRALVVLLGSELLTGEVSDENLPYLARELFELGVELTLALVLPDQVELAARLIAPLYPQVDHLITPGGIGPTPDDLTRELVCKLLDLPLVENPAARRLIEQFYGPRLTPERLRMALLPQGAEPIPSPSGGLPGFAVDKFICLPGIPGLVREMFPAVQERLRTAPFHRRSLEVRLGESQLAPLLRRLENSFPDLAIGSYPHCGPDGWRTRIVVRGKDPARVGRCMAELSRGISQLEGERT